MYPMTNPVISPSMIPVKGSQTYIPTIAVKRVAMKKIAEKFNFNLGKVPDLADRIGLYVPEVPATSAQESGKLILAVIFL
jgi:hypothetical protein